MSISVAASDQAADVVISGIAARVSALDGTTPGGGLLGPRLVVAAAGPLAETNRLVLVGTAVELLRRATLIHRAPHDESTGTVHGRLRLSGTLRGDMLFAESFRLLSEDGESRLGVVLSGAMAAVSESEVMSGLQCNQTHRIRLAAAYYRAAAATGAILGGLDGSRAEAMADWGQAVGEAHERALLGENVEMPACPACLPSAFYDWVLSTVGAPDWLP